MKAPLNLKKISKKHKGNENQWYHVSKIISRFSYILNKLNKFSYILSKFKIVELLQNIPFFRKKSLNELYKLITIKKSDFFFFH